MLQLFWRAGFSALPHICAILCICEETGTMQALLKSKPSIIMKIVQSGLPQTSSRRMMLNCQLLRTSR